ncbi:MAG: hypothetical protein LVQ64_04850, partial [Thermoplasmatales archaeon]|nr:hypothetical protein [Thermoplasmatales archaeon]
AATLTWLFTIHLDGRNWDNAPWGLSGAIADRQHVGGFRGLNAVLVREAIHRSLITSHRGLALRRGNVATALETSVDPFVRGVSGHPDGVRDLLAGLAIDGRRPPHRLAPEEEDRLAQALMDRSLRWEWTPRSWPTSRTRADGPASPALGSRLPSGTRPPWTARGPPRNAGVEGSSRASFASKRGA